jgi:hypothetical protein
VKPNRNNGVVFVAYRRSQPLADLVRRRMITCGSAAIRPHKKSCLPGRKTIDHYLARVSTTQRVTNHARMGWSWGYVATVDSNGQTIFVADAHRDNGKRFIVTADEKLRAFLELQRVTRESLRFPNAEWFGTIPTM